MSERRSSLPPWQLLSNHGLMLLAIAHRPDARMHELASVVGITERACRRIVNDLCAEGYVMRKRVGRCNSYRVNSLMPMRHPALQRQEIGSLLALLRSEFAPEWFSEPAAARV
ncbi:MAG TPA: helix-turn-helix domain-containing protein [Candidatus Dormibacteraeota bacterium]|nr:helix-turn-helix domain-containing protein [Candidatus Dormibacteraeota bacterium]